MAWRRGQAYGQDLRERVLGAWELSARAAAVRFAVSASYVAKVRGRLRRTGDTAPGPQRNHVPPRLAPLGGALRARVASGSDATLAELRAWELAEHGVRALYRPSAFALAMVREGTGHDSGPLCS
ncbi:MAG TPA: hypothetical protein VEX11_00170 [Acetobacteraceae bacterium]|nr:hypothetical protein [Acetobacteraceae bacterium]